MDFLLHPYLHLNHINIMLTLLIVVLALLGYAFFLTKVSSQKIEANFFISGAFAIVFLYVFAQFRLLDIGACCFFLLGHGLFLGMIIYLSKNKTDILRKYVTPGIGVTLLFIFLFSYLSRNLYLTSWDEFSHWMPHAKMLWAHHGFMTAEDQLVHKSYPPGGRLFYYLFYFISGCSEPATYLGQQLLVLSAVATITQSISWKNWERAFWIYLVTIIFIYVLKVKLAYTAGLYMDPITGVYLGCAVIFYQLSKKDAQAILYMTLPMVAACLFKVDMLPFVFIILTVVFSDQYIRFKEGELKKGFFLKNSLSLFLLIALIFSALLWWSHYLRLINVPHEGQSFEKLDFEKIKMLFFNHPFQSPFFCAFLKKYIIGILQDPLFMFLGITIAYFFIIKKETSVLEKKLLRAKYLIFFLGFLGYLGVFYIMYQFSFSQAEALRLASFFRYMDIYYLMIWLPTLSYFFDATRKLKISIGKKTKLFILCIILIGVLIDYHKQHVALEKKYRAPFLTQNLSKVGDATLKIVPQEKSIFLIWNDTSANSGGGLPIYIMKNYLLPRKIHLSSDAASFAMIDQLSKTQLADKIHASDYVLVVFSNESTWNLLSPFIKTDEKPFIQYQLCIPLSKKSCQVTNQNAYLFKVQKTEGENDTLLPIALR